MYSVPIKNFRAYYYAVYGLFKAHRNSIIHTKAYQTWCTFDLPDGVVLDKVPGEWKDMITTVSEIRDLIFAIETGLINIFEIFLYHCFQAASVKQFQSDLSARPLSAYIKAMGGLRKHLATDPQIDAAYCWFAGLSSSDAYQKFIVEHEKTIKTLSALKPDSTAMALFSHLYLQAFPLSIRKFLGEEYTPFQMVDFILDNVGYLPCHSLMSQKLLDPAAGLGIFMTRALKRLVRAYAGKNFIEDLKRLAPIQGVEFKLFSAKAAQLNMALHLLIYAKTYSHIKIQKVFPKTIQHGNALLNKNAAYNFVKYDYVVGNPPYLRIQNIKPKTLKNRYAKNYTSAKGRFDLAFLFIEKGLNCLKPNGCLGYITSNKLMTVAAGKSLRRLISQTSRIERIVDLGDTEYFTAAVLPCVLILRKTNLPDTATSYQYIAVTRWALNNNTNQFENINLFDFLKANQNVKWFNKRAKINNPKGEISVNIRGLFTTQPGKNGDTWHFLSPMENQIIKQMQTVANTTLKQVAEKIMVGIKTTADGIFVKPMSRRFIKKKGFESELVHPLLRGKNIKRWRISWSSHSESDRYILYPHQIVEGRLLPINLEDYPITAAYLKSHRTTLNKRSYVTAAGRKWYEIWVTQNPLFFKRSYKIMTPDFAPGNTFAIDTNGFYLGTSAMSVILNDQNEMFNYYILGLLNSKLYEFFHKFNASTFIYSGRFRYWSSYMAKYPIYDYRKEGDQNFLCKEIACIAKGLSSENSPYKLEKALDEKVYQLYGIRTDQIHLIRTLLK